MIGESGIKLSGGQRQRLGIARALYTRPKLLVLDEATSALDSDTEQAIAQTLQELAGSVTTVTIAHRLATIMHCDLVVYLEDGRVQAQGSFSEVRAKWHRSSTDRRNCWDSKSAAQNPSARCSRIDCPCNQTRTARTSACVLEQSTQAHAGSPKSPQVTTDPTRSHCSEDQDPSPANSAAE